MINRVALKRSPLARCVTALVTGAVAGFTLVATAPAAHADLAPPVIKAPVCNLTMVVRTGRDDLRRGSNFSVSLIVKTRERQYPLWSTGQGSLLGRDGMSSYSSRTFHVRPMLDATFRCPRSDDIIGIRMHMDPDSDFWGDDQWDLDEITIVDSLNVQVFGFNSTYDIRFSIEKGLNWERRDSLAVAPWYYLDEW